MALRRLELRGFALLCEWDEETGYVGVAMGGESRQTAWDQMEALHAALLRETGITWVDEELRERLKTGERRCLTVNSPGAVYWRATVSPVGGSRYVPLMIAAAAGISLEAELE